MSSLALSASFEYVCYVSTAIINIFFFQCRDRLQTSESDEQLSSTSGGR